MEHGLAPGARAVKLSGETMMNRDAARMGRERADTIGVEPFDTGYGAGLEIQEDAPVLECELVEDDGRFRVHRPTAADRPSHLCFIDGVMRTEARLTRTGSEGETRVGLAGSWAAGVVRIAEGQPARIDQVQTGRTVIFTGGGAVRLPPHRDGWAWTPGSVEGMEIEAAREQLRRLMRDAEMRIADDVCAQGWLPVFDGPLHGIWRNRASPVIGYVKTHHRRTLAPEPWSRVPLLSPGERSSLFAMGDDLYGSYLRIGTAGPWASPWAGIVRIEAPARVGREAAIGALDGAASWLPDFASPLHRDARAPVNLTPVSGLERRLHHLLGDSRLALRAVRETVLRFNRREGSA